MERRKLLFIFFKTKMTDTTTPAPVQSKPIVATPVEAIPLEAAIVNKEIALGDIPSEGIETTSQKKV